VARDEGQSGRLKAFISYSRSDEAFADELMLALQDRNFEVSLDRHSIREGEAWKERLGTLIADADTVVFVLSPDSARSTVCQWEVEYAYGLAKRIIPVLWRGLHEPALRSQPDGTPWPPGPATAPSRLAALNYVRFDAHDDGRPRSFMTGVRGLVSALETDLDWLREHTRLLARAREWDEGGRPVNRLLSGPDVTAAKALVDERKPDAPPMLPLQLDFLKASEDNEAAKADAARAELAERERLVKQAEIAQARTRWLQRRSYGVLALMLAATLAAVWQVYGFWQRVMLNRSEFIASQALDQYNVIHDRVTAELLALEALPDEDSTSALQRLLPFEGTAQIALHDAYRNYRNETWAERRLLSGHTAGINAVAFSPDGRLVLTGSDDNTARLWEAPAGKPVATLSGGGGVTAVAFSPDGRLVLTGSVWTARLWKTATGKPVATLSGPNRVTAVAFSPDGRLVLTGSSDKTARLWRAADGKPVATLAGDTGSVSALAFSPDGTLVLTTSGDNTARLWETATGKPVATLSGHTARVTAVAFSPDGRLVMTGSWDNTARLWEAATGKPVVTLAGHTDSVFRVAFSSHGRLVLTGSDDNTARLWETATGKPVATLSGHSRFVRAVAFSPDGRLVLTGSWDNTARLWEAATGKPVATLAGHTGFVNALAFSPDGRLVLTGSGDTTARLWEAATGKPVATLSGHTGSVYAVAFSPDGTLVLTGSDDTTARLWEALPTQSLIREAKSTLPRCLTPDQRQRFHLAAAPPRWCYSMKLWPYDDPTKTPMPPLTWDGPLATAWDALAFWAHTRSR
jgi:WD40 repeat protein